MPTKTTTKINEKQVQQHTQQYQQAMDSLQIHNSKLITQLITTKQTLATVKQRNTILQTQVYDLIDYRKRSDDTIQVDKNCNALENKVVELIECSNTKDSVYDTVIATLELQVKNKDSTLQTKDSFTNTLQTVLNESLAQQGLLSQQNKMYYTQFKRQKFKNKFIAVGVLIVGGLLANQLIQH